MQGRGRSSPALMGSRGLPIRARSATASTDWHKSGSLGAAKAVAREAGTAPDTHGLLKHQILSGGKHWFQEGRPLNAEHQIPGSQISGRGLLSIASCTTSRVSSGASISSSTYT